MVRFLFVVALGIAAGFVLAPLYWGILYVMRPLLDRFRAVVHAAVASPTDQVCQVGATKGDVLDQLRELVKRENQLPTAEIFEAITTKGDVFQFRDFAKQAIQPRLVESWQWQSNVRLNREPEFAKFVQQALTEKYIAELSGKSTIPLYHCLLSDASLKPMNLSEFVRKRAMRLHFQQFRQYLSIFRPSKGKTNVELQKETLQNLLSGSNIPSRSLSTQEFEKTIHGPSVHLRAWR